MKAIRLTHKKGMQLIREGYHLVKVGKNRDTLKYIDGTIVWSGMNDQGPTVFENDQQTKSLFATEWFLEFP
jgi:hypothetical protein